jgi:hypothetical protein
MGAYLVDPSGVPSLYFDVVMSEEWTEDAAVTDYNVEVGADVTDNVRVATRTCKLQVYSGNAPIQANWITQPVLAPTAITVGSLGVNPGIVEVTVPEWDNGIALRAALMSAGDIIGGAAGGPTGTLIGGAAGGILGALLSSGVSVPTPFFPSTGLQPVPPQTVQANVLTWAGDLDFVQETINQLRLWKNAASLLNVVGTKGSVQPMVIQGLTIRADKDTGDGRDITIDLREIRIVSTLTINVPAITRATPVVAMGNQNPQPTTNTSAAKQIQNMITATTGGPPATSTPITASGPPT